MIGKRRLSRARTPALAQSPRSTPFGENQDTAIYETADDVVYLVIFLGPQSANVAASVNDDDVGGTHHTLYTLPCALVLVALDLKHGETGKRVGEEALLGIDDCLIAQVSVAGS